MREEAAEEGPTYAERVALFERLAPSFTVEDVFEAGAALGLVAFKTVSCLREYQLAELVVQRDSVYTKRGDVGVG